MNTVRNRTGSDSGNRTQDRSKEMQQGSMRIAVVGVGVVGSYFGGRLAYAGENVVFVARGGTLAALKQHGLRVDSIEGSFVVQPVLATNEPKSVGTADVVLLAVKGWQVPEAIETVRPLMGPDTFIVPLIDGVEAPQQLAAAFGNEPVTGGIAVMLGRVVAPGHIRNGLPYSSISIGELDGHCSERIVRLQKAFERAGVTATIATDIVSAGWEKLLLVGPWSAVCALTRAPLAVVRNMPETRRLLEQGMREVLTVGRAHGAVLSDDIVNKSLAALDSAPAAAIGNLRDILDGRPSELETEIGVIVRLAQALGVKVPCHAFLYAGLLAQERKARGQIDFLVPEPEASKSASQPHLSN